MAGRIAYLGNIVTDGLILDLDAAKQESFYLTGSIWRDLSGRQNNSTLISASFTTGSGPETAISFTTGSMYLACTTPMAVSNNQFLWNPSGSLGSTSITVEVWFKSNQTVFTSNSYLFTKPWNGSGGYNYRLKIPTNNFIELVCSLSGSNYSSGPVNVPITDGNWKQVVLWLNPTQIGYYVNGTQYSGSYTHNVSGGPQANDTLALTLMTFYPYDQGANPSFSVTGSLANVKFYNRQLTQAEVVQNFNAYRTRYGI